MLKVHGANVAPAEVETCLGALPQIARAAVVGVATPEGDTELLAAVELRPGYVLDEAGLRAALNRELSSFKVPSRILALDVEDFPTASGKVRKPPLKALLEQMLKEEAQAEA